MRPESLDFEGGSNARFRAPTLAETQSLCPGQRFADQPAAAFCSGTLIDDDLVLTAGHCIENQEACERTRFVFDYFFEAPGTLASVSRSDVYGCRRLVVRQLDEGSRDYAIVQLDRPATAAGRVPAPVRLESGPVSAGTRLGIIGFGSGIPAKIDSGGRVLDPRPRALDFFTATTDSFGGNSGSGVFDLASGAVVGVLVRGDRDYRSDGSCFVVNELPEDGSTGGESITYVRPAIDALCASWPSERLCGSRATCGDGACNGGEDASRCPSDCAAAACGDGVCDYLEDETCPNDCPSGGSSGPPPGWTCPVGWWNAREGCDCGCGVRDPDCDVPGQRVFHCGEGQSCDADGLCVDASGSWFCPASYYGTRDGCDCECGAYDPDCDDPSQEVLNCPAGAVCGRSGRCVDRSGRPVRWLCAAGWLGVDARHSVWPIACLAALASLLRRRGRSRRDAPPSSPRPLSRTAGFEYRSSR